MIQTETAPPRHERREPAAPPSRAWWLVVGALAVGQCATLAAVLGPREAHQHHRSDRMPAMRVSEHHDLGAAEREEQERRRLGAVWSLKSVSAATTLTKHRDGVG